MKKPKGTYIRLTGFEQLKAGLKTGMVAKVGILGADAAEVHKNTEAATLSTGRKVRKFIAGSTITNAEIGVIAEFGSISKNIPARSFLRYPLETHATELVEAVAKSKTAQAALEKGDIKTVYKILGFEAEKIVNKAFTTSGFGQWAANAPATIAKKGSSMPNIDTSQLRRSISSEVAKI